MSTSQGGDGISVADCRARVLQDVAKWFDDAITVMDRDATTHGAQATIKIYNPRRNVGGGLDVTVAVTRGFDR